jgi:hypothetical protein
MGMMLIACSALVIPPAPHRAVAASAGDQRNSAIASGSPRAVLTANQVRATLNARQGMIYAFYFVMEEDPLPGTASKQSEHRRELAARAPADFFLHVAKRRDGLDFRYDPYQDVVVVNGHDVVQSNPWSRQFVREPLATDRTLPSQAMSECIYLGLGLWPTTGLTPPTYIDGTPVTFAQVAANPNYTVAPVQENINGRWCHVLELAKRDRLWVDVERGGVLMKREIFEPRNARTAQIILLDEYAMISPGIWWPMRITNTTFDPFDAGTRVRGSGKFRVVKIDVNGAVDSKLFAFEPGPGYVQIFDATDVRQVVPGGQSLVADVIERLEQLQQRRPNAPPAMGGASLAAVIGINILSCACVTLFMLRQRLPAWSNVWRRPRRERKTVAG